MEFLVTNWWIKITLLSLNNCIRISYNILGGGEVRGIQLE